MPEEIWKYAVDISAGEFTVMMPVGARVVAVQNQGMSTVMWLQVDPSAARVISRFAVVPTGQAIPDGMRYAGTFQRNQGTLVFHLFHEVIPEGESPDPSQRDTVMPGETALAIMKVEAERDKAIKRAERAELRLGSSRDAVNLLSMDVSRLRAAIKLALDGCVLCRQGDCRSDAHLWLSEALNDGIMRHVDQRRQS